ncbi:MAG TPA: hypothetical protein VK524_19925, partial [Polyangiaceae bacterium]|nr:hypothetical protein [Polyangiaceae bacterium]
MQKPWRRSGLGELGRVLGVALLVALAIELVYVLGATLILRAHLLERWLNSDPDDLSVRFDSAWSFVPGEVKVRGLRVRVQDSNVQFLLTIDEANASIALFELMQRRFHVTEVEAKGTRFSMRNRFEDVAGQELRARAYPPIEGFADPPLKGWKVPHRKLGAQPFQIEIERVDAEVLELWILEYRYEGPARARGGFRLIPRERVRVGPAELELAGGKLWFGKDRPLAEPLKATLRCRLEDFDVRATHGWHVFDHVSAKGSLAASIRGLESTRAYLHGSAVTVGAGAGTLSADLGLDKGRFLPGSRATYRSARIEFSKAPARLTGDVSLTLKVEERDRHPLGSLSVSAEKIEVQVHERLGKLQPAEITGMKMNLATRQLRLSETWKMAALDLAIPQAKVPDARLLTALAGNPKSFSVERGSAAAAARARLDS